MTTLPEQRLCSASYLRKMLVQRYPDHSGLFADLFALGCLLHACGERHMGRGLVARVLHTLGGPAEERYLASLLDTLAGNEMRFTREIEPALAVTDLYDRVNVLPAEAGCNR